jgi:hypothetical protein
MGIDLTCAKLLKPDDLWKTPNAMRNTLNYKAICRNSEPEHQRETTAKIISNSQKFRDRRPEAETRKNGTCKTHNTGPTARDTVK